MRSSRAWILLLLAGLLAAGASPPAVAHKNDAAIALVASDDVVVDGDLDDDAWDDADDEIKFSAPSGRTNVQFLWDPEEERLYVAIAVSDPDDDGTDDYLDFAFAFDHDDTAADDGDQVIARIYRDGTVDSVSVEDNDDVDAGTVPDGMEIEVGEDPGSDDDWTIEIEIDWDETHAGWAIVQTDDGDKGKYPASVNLEKPTTWADVVGQKKEVEVSLRVSPTTGLKIGDTIELVAEIDDFDDLVDEGFDDGERIRFERSMDGGTTWTSVASEKPDDDGEAEAEYRLPEGGTYRFRARVAEQDVYAEGVSATVTISVGDLSKKVQGDGSTFVRYVEDADLRRTYTLLANASGDATATWEASADGETWHRLATGTEGNALTTTWTPPDHAAWSVRSVLYDEDGDSVARDAVALASYALKAGKTATTVTLDVDTEKAPKLVLSATLAPAAATGTVTFWRAPDVVLGSATVTSGKASLEIAEALPGPQTYVARYGGSTTHAAAAGRDALAWWPDAATDVGARWKDATGEELDLEVESAEVGEDAAIEFSAAKGDGPGLAGYLRILVEAAGETTAVFEGSVPSGRAHAAYAPAAAGVYAVRAEFYRADGAGAIADVRNATFEVDDVEVEVEIELPESLRVGEVATLDVTLDPDVDGGRVLLEILQDGNWTEVVDAEAEGDSATFEWTPTAAGRVTIRAVYTGAPGFANATSEEIEVLVAEAVPDDDNSTGGLPGPDGELPRPTPAAAGLLALAALGAVAAARRSRT